MWIILLTNRSETGGEIKVVTEIAEAGTDLSKARLFPSFGDALEFVDEIVPHCLGEYMATIVKREGGKITLPGGEAVRS